MQGKYIAAHPEIEGRAVKSLSAQSSCPDPTHCLVNTAAKPIGLNDQDRKMPCPYTNI